MRTSDQCHGFQSLVKVSNSTTKTLAVALLKEEVTEDDKHANRMHIIYGNKEEGERFNYFGSSHIEFQSSIQNLIHKT